ncbi:MAG: hypothetical protein GEU95_00815 [Rhizobiales bacterium]|nr:hypothetical protein [Hyphomicrobiales bacterium]
MPADHGTGHAHVKRVSARHLDNVHIRTMQVAATTTTDRTRISRLRRHRARTRVGKIVLLVEVDEVALTEEFLACRFLKPNEAYDRDKLADACSRFLNMLTPGDPK